MKPDDWRRKNTALLHDPPLKHDAAWFRGEEGAGHAGLGRKLAALVEEEVDPGDPRAADRFVASADRPQLGSARQVRVPWRGEFLVTHPLTHAPVQLLAKGDRLALRPSDLLAHLPVVVSRGLDAHLVGVPQDERARAVFHWLWRRSWSALQGQPPAGTPPHLWRHYLALAPADTRCPDHGVRDHVRLTSALAWGPSEASPPWLFKVSVGPIGSWIREARTSRDLWASSMLLSEISFAAMRVVIDRYGPDAVIYPDLAANGRMDRQLASEPYDRTALTETELKARTRAALIPNAWLAVVPEGTGEQAIKELGQACRNAGVARWHAIADEVRASFLAAMGAPLSADELEAFDKTWKVQCDNPNELFVQWAALPWEAAVEEVVDPGLPAALPTIRPNPAWRNDSKARNDRFGPLVEKHDLHRYDRAAYTYQQVLRAAGWKLSTGAGHDYALTQHALGAALSARKHARQFPTKPTAAAIACTLCGHRTALGASSGAVDAQRTATSKVWERIANWLKWDIGGKERLCGVCATKRFLVPPWQVPQISELLPAVRSFHEVWAHEDDREGDQGRLRLPMPSTAAVAAAPWYEAVFRSNDPELRAQCEKVARAARAANWPPTFFPSSLPAVQRALSAQPLVGDFDRYEPSMLFKGPREAELLARSEAGTKEPPGGEALAKAIEELFEHTQNLKPSKPSSRFAVIALDGDKLSDLLLGKEDRIGSSWLDVLHPSAVEQIEKQGQEPWAKAWMSLLHTRRLMGPSLHAFLNRAVTAFANRIVPWVVEHEFRGRLIYAGGDDVLALAPAEDALGIAARLQQLWSAAWVLDTQPDVSAWAPTGSAGTGDPRERFRVFVPGEGGRVQPYAPAFAAHAFTGLRPAPTVEGEVVPMLGPAQSLSAGIAYAHFKTPLGLVVAEAKRVLDEAAKEDAGRAACAEVLYTRSGPKYRSVYRWGRAVERVATVQRVRDAFASGNLPSRLPYKLRGHGAALAALHEPGSDPSQVGSFLRGLILRALDGSNRDGFALDLADLWSEGVRAARLPDEPDDRSTGSTRRAHPLPSDLGLGNLLLCRALASDEDDA